MLPKRLLAWTLFLFNPFVGISQPVFWADRIHNICLQDTNFNPSDLVESGPPSDVIQLPQNDLKKRSLLYKKIFQEPAIAIKNDSFSLKLEPIFLFEGAINSSDSLRQLFVNSRGVRVSGNLKNSIEFQSGFIETQSILPSHIRSYIRYREVSPGLGRAKKFKENGSDYGLAWGSVKWQPNNLLALTFGHLKTFIGAGYRSLLLSDNSFFAPGIKAELKKGKFKYTQNWSLLQDINKGKFLFNPLSEPSFYKKTQTWQLLEFAPGKRTRIGVFYSAIWTHTNISTIIPLPLSQYLIELPQGTVNPLGGLCFQAKASKEITLYGQFLADGQVFSKFSNQRKTGYQVGILCLRPLNLKNLSLRIEYNQISPNTFSVAGTPLNYHASFIHYNQPLAHPLGSNFKEINAQIQYRIGRLFIWAKIIDYNRPVKPSEDFNSMDPVSGAEAVQFADLNEKTLDDMSAVWRKKGTIIDLQSGWLINPSTGLRVYAGASFRKLDQQSLSTMISAGIGIPILNQYTDF